jgi:lysozyme family protein
VIDDAVLKAARARNAAALIDALCDERTAFLKRLKTWDVFGAGWSRRVAEVRTVALRLAAGKPAAAPMAVPSKGKGAVPIHTTAQKTSTGGVVATGTVAAQQAHSAGATLAVIATIVIATLVLALAVWLLWRLWQRRQQQTPTVRSITPTAGSEA